ncbi:MAG TPA: phosphatase PAP2 family protein [Roseiflexaceae bacterium]|nr:phosphatase PAP2 family protein [Roseiflexaceae bacterium]
MSDVNRIMDDAEIANQPDPPMHADDLAPLGSVIRSLLIGAVVCIVGTLGFVWLASQVFADRFISFDDAAITRLHTYWGPISDRMMFLLTGMGEAVVLGVFVVLATVALWRKGLWIDAVGLAVAGIGAGLLNQALKLLYQRTRPDLVSGPFHLSSYSFPSGHSMGSIVCYGMLAFLGARLLRDRRKRAALIVAAALLVFGIGLSRVYFGVHFPTDVLGGFVAGAIWLIVCIESIRTAEWYVARRAARQRV